MMMPQRRRLELCPWACNVVSIGYEQAPRRFGSNQQASADHGSIVSCSAGEVLHKDDLHKHGITTIEVKYSLTHCYPMHN